MSLEQRKIFEIATNNLGNLDKKQIGFETTPDPDLCYCMWGGKSPSGVIGTPDGVSKWLAKDHRARVSRLTITEMSNAGIIVCDEIGRTEPLKLSNNNGSLLIQDRSSEPSKTDWVEPGYPGNILATSQNRYPQWTGKSGNGAETYFLENVYEDYNHYYSNFDHGYPLLISGQNTHIKIRRGESISGRISVVAIRYDDADRSGCFSCYNASCTGFCYDEKFAGLSSHAYEYTFHLMRMGHGQLAYYDPYQLYTNEFCEDGWLMFRGIKWGFNDRVNPESEIDVKIVPLLEAVGYKREGNKTRVNARVDLIRATAPEKGK